MCGIKVYYCQSGVLCVHPLKWMVSVGPQSLDSAIRFPQVDICKKAYKTLNIMSFAPPDCDSAVWEPTETVKLCSPCERHLGQAGAPPVSINTYGVSTVADVMTEAPGGSLETNLRLPDLLTSNNQISNESLSPDLWFRDTRPYVKHSMAIQEYNRDLTLLDHQVEMRALPTGQIVPQYFDMPLWSQGDTMQTRYRRGLNISRNQDLELPLAYETQDVYVRRQQHLRPHMSRAVIIDEYRAWGLDTSTPKDFLQSNVGHADACRLEYHPPFPELARPNLHRDTFVMTYERLLACSHAARQLNSDPQCDVQPAEFQSAIRKEMNKDYPHQLWVTHQSSFNPPADWLNVYGVDLEELRTTLIPARRYFWARSLAFLDIKPLPYETRMQYVLRQLWHKHVNERDPDIIHGWNYLYSQHIRDMNNRAILPLNPEGKEFLDNMDLWDKRDRKHATRQNNVVYGQPSRS